MLKRINYLMKNFYQILELFSRYDKWNAFDFITVLGSIADVLVTEFRV